MSDLESNVANAIVGYSPSQTTTFHELRGLVMELAVEQVGIGPVTETTKWGEPAYLTEKTKSGSTLRIAPLKSRDELALFVNCKTDLIDQFKQHYEGAFEFDGVRALVVPTVTADNRAALKHCIALTLLYHANKR